MPHAFHFLRNNLFTSYTLEVDFPQIYDFEGNKDQAKKAPDSIFHNFWCGQRETARIKTQRVALLATS